ncbi:hypothetical protein TNIN_386061 [Trichonephila inaurata madagascariensis]|uniref:Uncharacterized protein n=1 Tax=Trichonephila inaurata madagascariensis TaxID=2747483 RepID=A0A8X6XTW8_9ARAC|nr:hypothetical protein TNIN_386061 [Trichonephila inaurata madagascariensis]
MYIVKGLIPKDIFTGVIFPASAGNLKKNSIIKSKSQSASSGKARRHQASNLQHPSTPTPLLTAHPPSPFCLPDENLMKGNIPGKTQHLAHVTKEDNGHEEADDKGLIEKKGGRELARRLREWRALKSFGGSKGGILRS